MTDIQWVRVGHDLFVATATEHDGMRHPTSEELDLLIAVWDAARKGSDPAAASSAAFDQYMETTNRRIWLEHQALALGTENQRDRYTNGVLPYEELLALARAELFKVFDAPRWRPLSYTVVAHKGDVITIGPPKSYCRGRVDIASTLLYATDQTVPSTAIDHDAWERYRHVLRACEFLRTDHSWMIGLPPTSSVRSAVYKHTARCVECDAEVTKLSVRVIIPWADHKLTREYALEPR